MTGIKKIVYKYLDSLFGRANIRKTETENGTVYIAYINETPLFITPFQRRGFARTINFNKGEFTLIRNMFGLEIGDTVEIIRQYLGDNIDTSLNDLPFSPNL